MCILADPIIFIVPRNSTFRLWCKHGLKAQTTQQVILAPACTDKKCCFYYFRYLSGFFMLYLNHSKQWREVEQIRGPSKR